MREEVLDAAARAHWNHVTKPSKPGEDWDSQPVEVRRMIRLVVQPAVSAALAEQRKEATA